MKSHANPHPLVSIIPVVVLIALLAVVIALFGSDSLSGGSQIALILAMAVCVLISTTFYHVPWRAFEEQLNKTMGGIFITLLILLLFIPLLMCILPDTKSRSFADALTHERLLPWKGMCVLLILLSHYTGYITTSPSDETYLLIRSGMGQTVVVLFFFAAGYGMTLQLTSKGKGYPKGD